MHCPSKARGQPTMFVPLPTNNDYVFPPTLMMSHDELGEEKEEEWGEGEKGGERVGEGERAQ